VSDSQGLRLALLSQLLLPFSPDLDALARNQQVSRGTLDQCRAQLLAEAQELMAPDLPGWSLSRKLVLISSSLTESEVELAGYAEALRTSPATLRAWRQGYRTLLSRCGTGQAGAPMSSGSTVLPWAAPRRWAFA